MKFHAPSSPWFDRTNADVWFRTAEAAEAAGFVNAEAKAEEKADEKAVRPEPLTRSTGGPVPQGRGHRPVHQGPHVGSHRDVQGRRSRPCRTSPLPTSRSSVSSPAPG